MYSRIPDNEDYGNEILASEYELRHLTHYPHVERLLTATSKVFLALLGGGSTVVTLVMLGTKLSLPVIIGFFLGAAVYAMKAARNVYKRRQQEQKLTAALKRETDEMGALFDRDLINVINQLIEFSREHSLTPERARRVCTHLHELRRVIDIVFRDMDPSSPAIQAIDDGIKAFSQDVAPDEQYNVINFIEPQTKFKPLTAQRIIKKIGNRSLSFVGGASSLASIAIGVASLAFGITSPAGWAFTAIVGVALLGGCFSVAVDYLLSRREEKKTKILEFKNREFDSLHKGVVVVKNTFKRVYNNTCDDNAHREKEKESEGQLEKLRLDNAAKSDELLATRQRIAEYESQLTSFRFLASPSFFGKTAAPGNRMIEQSLKHPYYHYG